jgi:hypothetical protein
MAAPPGQHHYHEDYQETTSFVSMKDPPSAQQGFPREFGSSVKARPNQAIPYRSSGVVVGRQGSGIWSSTSSSTQNLVPIIEIQLTSFKVASG